MIINNVDFELIPTLAQEITQRICTAAMLIDFQARVLCVAE